MTTKATRQNLSHKLRERSTYYHVRYVSSYDEHTKQLVDCIAAAQLKGISIGLKLAEEMALVEEEGRKPDA